MKLKNVFLIVVKDIEKNQDSFIRICLVLIWYLIMAAI